MRWFFTSLIVAFLSASAFAETAQNDYAQRLDKLFAALHNAPDEAAARCCQTNAHSSLFALTRPVSGSAELTPLSESSVTVDLEVLPAGEAAFLVEMVEDRGMNGCELL